jgi:glycosyltransferase involved in cell wall biosynthesis
MRILLSAYACEPGRGSEPGVGWSWATELARLGHRVWVLTRADNRAAVESDAAAGSTGLTFIYYDLPRFLQRWRRGTLGKLLYYILWQASAVGRIRKAFPQLPFDVVHHVTYASIRYPSFLGRLSIPFCFGPVCGGEVVPRQLTARFSARERWRERLRKISNRLVPLDPISGAAFRRATSILVTPDTLLLMPQRWRHKARIQLAIGLPREYLRQAASSASRSAHNFRVLFVGRLLDCKGVDIALHAIARARAWHPDLRFTVVGDGPARVRLEDLAKRLKISEMVFWTGWLPRPEVEEQYRAADVLLFPALRDSGGMVVLEALAHGIPVICTSLGGPGGIVNERCGRVLPAQDRSLQQLEAGFADALHEIFSTPGLWQLLAAGAAKRAQDFDFRHVVSEIYPDSPASNIERAS